MEHLVILNVGYGNWDIGFPNVTAQIWLRPKQSQQQGAETGQTLEQNITPLQCTGSLPGCPQLADDFRQWQQLYTAIYGEQPNWRKDRSVPEFEFEEAGLTNVSSATFFQLCESLQQGLNRWLDADGFRPIERHLRTILSPSDRVRIMVVAQERQLLRLPWSLWNFLEDYPRAEIAVSPPDYGRSLKSQPVKQANSVNILAILGSSQDINVDADRHLLEALPEVELTLLTEPTWEELSQHLWKENWDIFFFAGHSSSKGPCQSQGFLQINKNEQITIAQLKYALKRSIETGLQLAVLNSCDGLGLAWDLTDLQIPQVIVMREPVPDRVAQEFLKHFLTSFSNHQTLYLAVREAREKLQSLEAQFACASWLPVIVQNPAEHPPSWRSLTQGPRSNHLETSHPNTSSLGSSNPETNLQSSPPTNTNTHANTQQFRTMDAFAPGVPPVTPPPQSPSQSSASPAPAPPPKRQPFSLPTFQHCIRPLASALGTTVLLLLLRWFGMMVPLELWALDQLQLQRPIEGPDPRLLVITIDEADIQAQVSAERQVSLSDETLETLLNFLNQAQASIIGIDLYRDFPVSEATPALANQLKNQQIIGICKGRDPLADPTGIAPPPEMAASQVGFSDFLIDDDGVLRRQLILMTPDPASPCTPYYSFASQIVFNYLGQQGIEAKFTQGGNLQLGSSVFPRLRSRSGGYGPMDDGGNQILLHYRALDHPDDIAPQVSLSQVLRGELNPEAVRDRIVLIGVTAPSQGDFWATPYGSSSLKEVPGVFIHAQMVSQLLSATLDDRPTLGVWPHIGDGLWILTWAIVGGSMGLVLQSRRPTGKPLRLLICWNGGAAIVVFLSFLLLLRGRWVPLVPAIAALLLSGIPVSLASPPRHLPPFHKPE